MVIYLHQNENTLTVPMFNLEFDISSFVHIQAFGHARIVQSMCHCGDTSLSWKVALSATISQNRIINRTHTKPTHTTMPFKNQINKLDYFQILFFCIVSIWINGFHTMDCHFMCLFLSYQNSFVCLVTDMFVSLHFYPPSQ